MWNQGNNTEHSSRIVICMLEQTVCLLSIIVLSGRKFLLYGTSACTELLSARVRFVMLFFHNMRWSEGTYSIYKWVAAGALYLKTEQGWKVTTSTVDGGCWKTEHESINILTQPWTQWGSHNNCGGVVRRKIDL